MRHTPIDFALLLSRLSMPAEPLVQIDPKAREGKPPCGECHLNPGERCNICGAVEAESGAAPSGLSHLSAECSEQPTREASEARRPDDQNMTEGDPQ